MTDFDFDLFTIGGGSGGVRASRFAAQLGARVAIAEGGEFGGTCVNVGCIPKKLMSMAAHYHEDFEDAVGFGWGKAHPGFDWPTLMRRKDQEIQRLNGLYAAGLQAAGATVLRGWASIIDPHTVKMDGQEFRARHILVATGSTPSRAALPGAELAITSDEFFHLPTQPKRALVYGGGYIAVELASILNGLGTATTLAYRGERLVREFDADLGQHLAQEMARKGVALRLSTVIEKLEQAADGAIRATFQDGSTLEADCVLFATGRLPRVAGLGLENAGVQLAPNGAIVVDEHLRSSVPSIFAIGDVIDRLALTPIATSEGMVVAEFLFGKPGRVTTYDLTPTAVFSHPNIATVGLSESQARARGHLLKIFRSAFTPLRHTLSGRAEKTLMKIVVDSADDRVLGVHMVGPEAGEIIQGFAVALVAGATKAQFDATIGIHPTAAEEFVTMRTPVTG
jgi:glutathione reductase (NADPH)